LYRSQPASEHRYAQENNPFQSERALLLENIHEKLFKYDEVLMKARELAEFQRPGERDWLNLRTWLYNEKPLNFEPEEVFIRMRDDLITLKPRADWGKIDGWIELAISNLSKWTSTKWTTTVSTVFAQPK
jgi:hypothetical protein